ncbi:FAD:protein FMN transferase [uncultured Polaribacter sp.]|uniref:FAD:protein FMN transferase n=1 Tax=uncultured Polaribacter sp. TaxID=174711 RepID=UPI0026185140|nr:FAD:protein FMN transferase [uncultured Polaribacter sp.]
MIHRNFFTFITFIILFSACQKEKINLNGNVFGTTYNISYLDTKINYQKQIDSLFYLVNKSLSTYIPTSDISKINNGDATVIVDDFFMEVFNKSKKIFKETDGYFDPTVGNLVNAYGFGSKKRKKNLTMMEVKELMQFVGLDKVSLQKRKIVKEDPQVYLEFNSIAKGFGIDVIARFFESKKIANYLIEIGGEIRAKGQNQQGKLWSIGLDYPNSNGTRSLSKIIKLNNKSVAGSGNFRKFRITDEGKKYVHTVNPKTGFAKESNLLSVYVIADLDCADVDAYATAFMAMGLEKTKEFLKTNSKIEAILHYLDAEGNFKEFSSYSYK